MIRVNISREFIAVIMVLVIVVSCENKPIDKSKYEMIALKDAHLQINLVETDPNANGIKMFAATARYCDSEVMRSLIGAGKDQVVFGEPETDVAKGSYVNLSAYNIKRKVTDVKNGQLVNIYFRLERKNGRIHKLEIDLIEEANVELVSSKPKAKLIVDIQQLTFSFVDVNSDAQLSYNKIIIDSNEVIDTKFLEIYSSEHNMVYGVYFEFGDSNNVTYKENTELNYKIENGLLTILGIVE